MVKFEEIKKEYDPGVLQTTQRSVAPFHVHFPFSDFHTIFFNPDTKKIHQPLWLSVIINSSYANLSKTSKSHQVAQRADPSNSSAFGYAKAFQAIHYFFGNKKKTNKPFNNIKN